MAEESAVGETLTERRFVSFYRIATAYPPLEEDYRTHGQKRGAPPPSLPPSLLRSWNEGLSAFDTEAAAVAQARAARGRLGFLVVRCDVPEGAGITWEQSGKNPHHFDLFGDQFLLARWLTDHVTEVTIPGAGKSER